MGLLDALFGQQGQQAQVPGATQQPSGLQQLFSPEVAMPVAAALLGNQGNAANFGNALGAYGQVKAQTAQKNKTMDFFRQQAPDYAAAVEAGMPLDEAWKSYTQQKYAQKQGQGFISVGGGNLFDTATGKWLSAPGGGSESKAGLQMVWLRDTKTNKPVPGQLRQDGSIVRSSLPPGVEAVAPYDVNFDKSAGTAAGTVSGTAAGALPGATQMASQIDQQVQDIKNDPYLPSMLGPVDSRLPNVSADAARVQGKLNQLQGGAFLQARQMLKGGGAITDYEGQKAEGAYARLNQAQTPEDFKAALDEFNYYVQAGLQKLQAQAGQRPLYQGGGMGQQQQPAPAQGGNQTQSGVTWSVVP
jgi:hypothetical protein